MPEQMADWLSRVRAAAQHWQQALLANDQRRQFEIALACSVIGSTVLSLSAPPWLALLNAGMVSFELLLAVCYWRRPQWLKLFAWLLWATINFGAVSNTIWVGGLWSANTGYFLLSSVGLLMVVNLRAVLTSMSVVSVLMVIIAVLEWQGYFTPSSIPFRHVTWPIGSFFVLFFAFIALNLIIYHTQKTAARQLNTDNQRLTETEDLLRHQHLMQEQFVASVSHELRTPIHAIMGFVQTIHNRDVFDEYERELLYYVELSSRQLLLRINELLDFSQLQAGKLRVRLQALDLVEELAQLVTSFQPSALDKQLKLRFEASRHVPNWVHGDRERIVQVARNLVGNAIKFTEVGEVRVAVDVDDQGLTVLAVHDTGVGIATEEQERIFNRLSSITSRTRREMGGTGLGLSITKALTELMGGTLSVESALGQGTLFVVKLPLSTVSPPEVMVADSGLQLEKPHARVLIVDDSAINRLVAQNMLRAEFPSIEVRDVDSGKMAIERLSEERFDLVLMDLIMPELNGVETSRRIRELLGRDSPAILGLTADASEHAREQCLSAGMLELIHKPFDQRSLSRPVAQTLNARAQAVADRAIKRDQSAGSPL